MKIGITCYPTYGGSGVVATELGIELAARGHDIHFITYSQPFRLTGREANIHFHEVAVSNYPLFEHPPYDLALATRMAEVAEFYSLDLLHVHYAIPHSVSALLAKQMLAANGRKLPFITTLHGTDITLVGLDASYLPITRFGIVKSDGVTAISSHLRDRTREAFGITSEIEVIPNFVNCDVYVRNPEVVATMRPRFAPANELLPLADLMVMPSEMESFGLAALEAMACGVPSIATRVGGVPELIEDGRNGLLFDVGDVDSMAKAAISLLSDDSRLTLMAQAARQTAQDRFCASRIIPLYEHYYDRVIARTTI